MEAERKRNREEETTRRMEAERKRKRETQKTR